MHLQEAERHVTLDDTHEERIPSYSSPFFQGPIGTDQPYNCGIHLQGAARHVTLGQTYEESLPSLLTNLPAMAVKNTFIHFEVDSSSDEEGALQVRKIKSAPNRNSGNPRPLQQSSYLLRPQPDGLADCLYDDRTLQGNPLLGEDAVQTNNDEVMQSLPSVGSVEHTSGNCRPCAWFWKRQGCRNSAECRHCHLCPESELKRRKKEKVQALRHQERAQLAA